MGTKTKKPAPAKKTILPSRFSFYVRKTFSPIPESVSDIKEKREGRIVFFAGAGFLVFVPIFKTVTHFTAFYGHVTRFGTHVDNYHHHS